MHDEPWTIVAGDGPIVAAAIHDGHEVRPELMDLLALDEAVRRREEDPFTGAWTAVGSSRIVVKRSRFEFDLNRPREKAVYRSPEDAWGLTVWKRSLPPGVVERSLALYDRFYREIRSLLDPLVERHGRIAVLDLHSYNHRRDGPDAPPAPARENPEVNVGTGSMDREVWAPVVDRFCAALRGHDFLGRRLDVRENVKFRGGFFSRWLHETYPGRVCGLALEFKKRFMDEWSGRADPQQRAAIEAALRAVLPAIREGLEAM
jgi:N-formylglutamate amidohydrolase